MKQRSHCVTVTEPRAPQARLLYICAVISRSAQKRRAILHQKKRQTKRALNHAQSRDNVIIDIYAERCSIIARARCSVVGARHANADEQRSPRMRVQSPAGSRAAPQKSATWWSKVAPSCSQSLRAPLSHSLSSAERGIYGMYVYGIYRCVCACMYFVARTT